MSAFQKFVKVWFEPAAVPIYVVVSMALTAGGYSLVRLATDPNTVYSNKNPYPWNDINPHDYPRKLMLINKEKYEKLRSSTEGI